MEADHYSAAALSGVEWTEIEPEKCTSPAFMNHIYKLVRCVLFIFAVAVYCMRDSAPYEISHRGTKTSLKSAVGMNADRKALLVLVMDKKEIKDR